MAPHAAHASCHKLLLHPVYKYIGSKAAIAKPLMDLTAEEHLRAAAVDLSTRACGSVQRLTELSDLILKHSKGKIAICKLMPLMTRNQTTVLPPGGCRTGRGDCARGPHLRLVGLSAALQGASGEQARMCASTKDGLKVCILRLMKRGNMQLATASRCSRGLESEQPGSCRL